MLSTTNFAPTAATVTGDENAFAADVTPTRTGALGWARVGKDT